MRPMDQQITDYIKANRGTHADQAIREVREGG
jgi:hypothetical protein